MFKSSLRFQLLMAMSLVAFLSIAATSGLIFYKDKQELEDMLGKNLLNIARTGTVAIAGDLHEEIFEKEQATSDEFKELQKILQHIKEVNHLETDVYTLRRYRVRIQLQSSS